MPNCITCNVRFLNFVFHIYKDIRHLVASASISAATGIAKSMAHGDINMSDSEHHTW